jgi:hypothetical protein
MPSVAVLASLLLIVTFAFSHSVEGTDWAEPVLLWMSICMPTGTGKSSLCKYVRKLVREARRQCGLEDGPFWLLDDQSFEKMGDLMQKNHWKLLGLYDELPMFLSQINICRGRGLTESHELAIFLQLYGADPWVRRTGMYYVCMYVDFTVICLTTDVPYFIVSGEANFTMHHTGLTVGGFTQPSVARSLIEHQPNMEKGLCQRFLWLVPKPNPVRFNDLECVDQSFSTAISKVYNNTN